MKSLDQPNTIETLSVYIEGKVQGVGFRAATVREAHALGVGGWVCNLPDGRVNAVIQGEHDAVDRMLSWLLHGPATARVDALTHESIDTARQYAHFEQA